MFPHERQGHEAAPPPSQGAGREITQEVAAGTFLPDLLFPGTRGAETWGPYGTKRTLPLTSQGEPSGDIVLFSPPQGPVLPGLHLDARDMTNTLKTKWIQVRPVSGNSMPDPTQSVAKAST